MSFPWGGKKANKGYMNEKLTTVGIWGSAPLGTLCGAYFRTVPGRGAGSWAIYLVITVFIG